MYEAIESGFQVFCPYCSLQPVDLYILIGCVSWISIASPHIHTEQRDPSVLSRQLLCEVAQQLTHTRYSSFASMRRAAHWLPRKILHSTVACFKFTC